MNIGIILLLLFISTRINIFISIGFVIFMLLYFIIHKATNITNKDMERINRELNYTDKDSNLSIRDVHLTSYEEYPY